MPIEIEVINGIRQGNSLGRLLFSLVMDELIKPVPKLRGYKMGDKEIKILWYADAVVRIDS